MQLTRIAWGSAVVVLTTALLLTAPVLAAGVKTSKERLSDKASDDQRVDNCKVPVERRGTVPRPGCQRDDAAAGPKDRQSTGQN